MGRWGFLGNKKNSQCVQHFSTQYHRLKVVFGALSGFLCTHFGAGTHTPPGVSFSNPAAVLIPGQSWWQNDVNWRGSDVWLKLSARIWHQLDAWTRLPGNTSVWLTKWLAGGQTGKEVSNARTLECSSIKFDDKNWIKTGSYSQHLL